MPYPINQLKQILTPIFKAKGVHKAILFGPHATGEATEKCHIDIVAYVDPDMSILDFCEIADEAINALGKEVNLLHADDIVPGGDIDLALQTEGVLIYAKG
ncbi:MAG: hypothetical protein FWG38_03980 [Defluviitaleaceae bacterium]|jgi:predicted nucleotidyltransferase|nr:hypothetical protein [Defluviitaleaceae bacterium]